ncbi:MAG: 2-oxo acid dehydrogenase subunit E2, partial [Chitinimonas sp.]|nr:2-oxo acid dehydrogenase subunit E2 [Chitinimonas sp.]
MLIEVKVPQLPESVSEATLVSWKKKVGDYVERDENLIDLETDKVVLELPAPQAGVIVSLVKGDGATVVSQELIATIDTEAKAGAVAPAATAAAPAAPETSRVAAAAAAAGVPENAIGFGTAVMPAAKKAAADAGIDASKIAGSGRDGRVLKEDVVAAAAKPAAPAAKAAAPAVAVPAGDRSEQRVPMSRLRQRVAERLIESQSTAAILTTFNEVNMKPVMDLRNRYKDRFEKEHGIKLGFMGFFVKAAVHALKKYPIVNASVDGSDIVYHGYYDIGVAVGSPRGLVVPVIRNADQL